ncbi:MAG: RNA methyltransferase [Verrucomicrobiae bacterium]|jgi:tRNA G18 (ribose-2'-O)-methylase SpoU|nr:RNA methyltransferase [Verrucomicrobiae bacterium]
MLHVHTIDDLGHPELRPYMSLRQEAEHRRQGIFAAEGAKITVRLLESTLSVRSLLLPEPWLEKLRPMLERRTEEIHAFIAQRTESEKLTGLPMYQGVTSIGNIPAAPSMDEIFAQAPGPRLFVATDDLTGSDNMGTVARNGVAFGADAMIVGDTCCSAWLRKSVRTSMGTLFKIPILESDDLPATLRNLRKSGVHIVAAHAHTDQRRLSDVDLTGDVCIVLGSEGNGLRESVLAECDDHALIPMHNNVDSLNVGSAGSVFLYEVARQRGFA